MRASFTNIYVKNVSIVTNQLHVVVVSLDEVGVLLDETYGFYIHHSFNSNDIWFSAPVLNTAASVLWEGVALNNDLIQDAESKITQVLHTFWASFPDAEIIPLLVPLVNH